MIKPSIGRVVLVQRIVDGAPVSPQPEPGLVCYVHNDRLINVGGFDANGKPFACTSLQLLQDEETPPNLVYGAYAEWMPYQKEQEAKERAVKKILEDAAAGRTASHY